MRRLTNEELKAENARCLLHPMTHPGTARDVLPDIIARGEGSWIWDIDGHRLVAKPVNSFELVKIIEKNLPTWSAAA